MKKKFVIIIAGFIACALAWAQEPDKEIKHKHDARLDAQQYLEIVGASMQTLQTHFVDSIDWGRVLRAGIDAMMMELDPYTQFYSEDDQSDYKQMTTGEYAGIGSIIQQRGDTIVVSEPYEGMPAALAGLQIGDRILSIDGDNMTQKTTAQVSERLRGQPNTSFKLKVLRPFEGEKEFEIVRKQIVLEAVPYHGWMNDSIAYIQLNQFTDKAALGVQTALVQLREDPAHSLKGVVLDLRGNPGGLLDEAVKIVGMFVPKGSMVVETRARISDWNSTYRTNSNPIEPELPIVVMVNRSSASASEIVSGALQDLDRAVILGERSFGKGLVQSSRPLPYNTMVKFTSAKYYIPSGRCVQAIDYQARRMARWEQEQDDKIDLGRIPDSLTHVFHTAGGREVRDGGGIKPDVEIKPEMMSNFAFVLERENIFFDYATKYCFEHRNNPPTTGNGSFVTDAEMDDFDLFVRTHLRDTVVEVLKLNVDHDLDSLRSELRERIEEDLAQRYNYQRGAIRQALLNDKWSLEATAILSNKQRYEEILKPVDSKNAKARKDKPTKAKARKTEKSKITK